MTDPRAMTTVVIHIDEAYPVFWVSKHEDGEYLGDAKVVEVDAETLKRWADAEDTYNTMQGELLVLSGYKR